MSYFRYIRLLYQFECHKCQKPVNHAILYNESALTDSNNTPEQKQTDVRYRAGSRSSEAIDERRERDYKTIQEIEHRKSLTRMRSSPPSSEGDYHYARQQDLPVSHHLPVHSAIHSFILIIN